MKSDGLKNLSLKFKRFEKIEIGFIVLIYRLPLYNITILLIVGEVEGGAGIGPW